MLHAMLGTVHRCCRMPRGFELRGKQISARLNGAKINALTLNVQPQPLRGNIPANEQSTTALFPGFRGSSLS